MCEPCNAKKASNIEKIRVAAQIQAKTEKKVFIIFQNSDGVYGFCHEGEAFVGKLIEYVYY